MDATGLSAFSALPLFPLMGLLWYLEKHSRQDIGLVGGGRLAMAWPSSIRHWSSGLSEVSPLHQARSMPRRLIGAGPGAKSR